MSLHENEPQQGCDHVNEADTEIEEVKREELEKKARDRKDLDLEHFGYVWYGGEEPTGEFPADLSKYFGPDGKIHAFVQVVGSARSIFWLEGFDELVQIIDDPLHTLQDEFIDTPNGCSPARFLLNHYHELRILPEEIASKYRGSQYIAPSWMKLDLKAPILVHVTRDAQQLQPEQVFLNYRHWHSRRLPRSIQMARVKNSRSPSELAARIKRVIGDKLWDSNNDLLFRGFSSLRLLSLYLMFFFPMMNPDSYDMEHGPGIYTTDSLENATQYARSGGAIMVFKAPDYNSLNVWRPSEEEWKALVAIWLTLPLKGVSLSGQFDKADVVIGPISTDQVVARREKRFPEPSREITQSVFVSHHGCEILRDSLVSIIFLENEASSPTVR